MKLNLQNAKNLAGTRPANIENVILARPDQIKKQKPERKTRQIQTYLTEIDYQSFIALIGRKPASHALYEMVHEFIRKHKQ